MTNLPLGYLSNHSGLCGTVSIIAKNEQNLVIMTCGHVLKDFSGTITIETSKGDAKITAKKEQIQSSTSVDEDIAFIVVPKDEIRGNFHAISYAPLYLHNDAFLRNQKAVSLGYPVNDCEGNSIIKPILASHTLSFQKTLPNGGMYGHHNLTNDKTTLGKPAGYDLACVITSQTYLCNTPYSSAGTQNGMSGGPVLIMIDNALYNIGMNGVSPPPSSLKIMGIDKNGDYFSDEDNAFFTNHGLWRSSWHNWECAPKSVNQELMSVPEYASQLSQNFDFGKSINR